MKFLRRSTIGRHSIGLRSYEFVSFGWAYPIRRLTSLQTEAFSEVMTTSLCIVRRKGLALALAKRDAKENALFSDK